MAANITGKYTIGIDYGSLSARAVLMDIGDGSVAASCVCPYPHAVLSAALPDGTPLPPDWALQVPADYREALKVLLPQILAESGIDGEPIRRTGTHPGGRGIHSDMNEQNACSAAMSEE